MAMNKPLLWLVLAFLALAAAGQAAVPASPAAGQNQGWKGVADRLSKTTAKTSKAEPAAKPPAAKKPEEAAELAPVAKGAPLLLPEAAILPLREVLAPFARSIVFAGPKNTGDPAAFRVLFEGFDGEFLELEMAWDKAAGEMRPAGANAESRGRDRAAVEALVRSYGEVSR
jgi:hypothetical protein